MPQSNSKSKKSAAGIGNIRKKTVIRNGKEYTKTGRNLLAKAFCHEIDHLSGVLFTDKMIEAVQN